MTPDLLIHRARIWPSVDAPLIEDGKILIRDGRIAKIGHFHARAEMVIDADHCLVMPGLIQGHVHLGQTLFRGLAEDCPGGPEEVVWPLEAAHDADSLRAAALLACAEMIRGGVTAFLSMETVRDTGAIFEAADQAGLMGVIAHGLMDESGGYPPLAVEMEDALAECEVLLDQWGGHDLLRLGLAPRSALGCSEQTLREAVLYAREKNLLLHSQACGQRAEVEQIQKRTGMAPILYLEQAGLAGPDVCLAHCVHLSERELARLAETDTRILHCPAANLKLGAGVAPVPDFLAAGLTVALGSGGASCNNRLDLFTEMRLAALVQKPLCGPEALPAREVARMATESGARALGWENEMGTLAEGKRANLILVETTGAHVAPCEDPATNLAYGHAASDVVMTMVNGKILYEDGRVTTLDEERTVEDARRQKKALLARAGFQ